MRSDKHLPQICLIAATLPLGVLLLLLKYTWPGVALISFDLWLVVCMCLLPMAPDTSNRIRLGPLSWEFGDFRRHWLCVGKSGCGKTLSFLKTFLLEVVRKMPTSGGVAIDEKGDFWELLVRVFKAVGLSNKLIVFRVGLPNDKTFKPIWTINLIGNRSITNETWAQIVVDVAVSQGQKSSNAHFKNQARQRIGDILDTLEAASMPITLATAYEFMKYPNIQNQILELLKRKHLDFIKSNNNLDEESVYSELVNRWEQFFSIGGDEASSIRTIVENYLSPYKHPAIASVFSSESPNVTFDVLDEGKWLVPSVPQAYLTERSYITAFFKILFYNYGLGRFDRGSEYLQKANDLILLADEGQNSILASEEGMSDIKSLDKLRAANCTVVFCMQDYASAIPPIEKKEKATVLFANLNNHVIFSLNTPDGRKIAADIIDKREVDEITRSVDSAGRVSTSRKKHQKYIFEPSFFKDLKKFHCVIQHCEGAYALTVLPPLSNDGRHIEKWYWIERFKTA